jgi:hypothetical protein
VNPHHLLTGWTQDNIDDCRERGRMARGQMMPQARLTPDAVRTIRGQAADGQTHAAIARQFQVHRSVVSAVVARKSWAHVA